MITLQFKTTRLTVTEANAAKYRAIIDSGKLPKNENAKLDTDPPRIPQVLARHDDGKIFLTILPSSTAPACTQSSTPTPTGKPRAWTPPIPRSWRRWTPLRRAAARRQGQQNAGQDPLSFAWPCPASWTWSPTRKPAFTTSGSPWVRPQDRQAMLEA